MKLILILSFLILSCAVFERSNTVQLDHYQASEKTVEIKGEVQSPGVYDVGIHDTIDDIIKISGGLKEDADTSSINCSLDIENNSVIVIPKKQEDVKISLNSASLEQLDELPGVGQAIATRILLYRKDHPFTSIEEIMEVKGIGEKMYEKIKDRICL